MIQGINSLSLFGLQGIEPGRKTAETESNNKALLSFGGSFNTQASYGDEKDDKYQSDAQQLNQDAVWLAELYTGLQNGEEWAVKAAKELQVAADPDSSDNSTNAQLLRSNNELARAIKTYGKDSEQE